MNVYGQSYKISNVINYLRKSRQDIQREKLTGEDTLTAQRKLMTNVLDHYGVPYIQKMEIGSGDKISTRPVFQEVLKELATGKFDAIAVKEISRLGRGSYSDMGIITDALLDNNIYIITPNRIYDLKNSADLKQFRFEIFLSREEFETIRERLTGARHIAALEGKWMGNIPFGYSRNPKTLRLEPVEEDAKVIQLIFNLYLNGYQGKTVRERAISTILKRLGIKTAKGLNQWDTTQISRVLKNDAYIGVSKFRTTKRNSQGKIECRPEEEHIVVEEAHESIIEAADFFKVQEIMKKSARPKTKLDIENYELTALFTCKKCGTKMVVNRYKRKRLNDEYYDMYIKCRNGCFCVKYNFAENAIIELLKRFKDIDENILFEMYSKNIHEKDKAEKAILQENIKQQINQQKEKLNNKLTFIFEKYEDGIYSDQDFLKRKRDIEEEIKELQLLEEGKNEIAATAEKINPKEIQQNFIKMLDAYNDPKITAPCKNELLRSIFEQVTIDVIEKGTKKHAPKLEVEAVLTNDFWEGNF